MKIGVPVALQDGFVQIDRTLWYAITMSVGFGLIIATAIQFTNEPVIRLFTEDPGVILLGGQYLRSYVWDCVCLGITFSFCGYFCACGMSGISFLHNILSIILVRIPGAYLASRYFTDTLFPMGLVTPAGSFLSVIICITAFVWITRRRSQPQSMRKGKQYGKGNL